MFIHKNKINLIIILILITSKVFSLDITIPLKIYEPLSKSISTQIPGSSFIIIDKNNIEKFSNAELANIIDLETGIKSRSIYGSSSSGSKTTIDIRGMGAQAKSNVLIMINGQRLNNIDMSEIDFPSIPIESIDSIEVIKGSAATVLYGEGAIGGAINIITSPDRKKKTLNEIKTKIGTFNEKELVWNNSQKIEKFYFNTYFNHHETNGYRDENEQQQNNLTSEFVYPRIKGDHFFSISFNEQIMSTPSDRSQKQLYSDRSGSDTPDDYINSLGGSFLYSMDYKIDDYKTFIFNSSFRLKDSYSDLQSTSSPSYSDTSLTNYQLTPRINQTTNFFEKILKITYGLDFQYADYKSYRKKNENAVPLHVYDAWQTSQSIYSQQSLYLTSSTTLGTGLRMQNNRIAIGDHLDTNAPDYAGWQTEHVTLSDEETNYAANIGLDHSVSNNLIIYGKLGNGFRYPNIDDRIGGSGGTSLKLKTQTTKDFEIGTKYISDKFSLNITTYIIDGENELAYDSDAFENINMNSTRRYGVELSTKNKFFNKINLTNNFTLSKAEYTSGDQGTYATDFKGNEVPLVPLYSLDTILEYKINDLYELVSSVNYQDEMRMESDDENFQPKIPGYAILNLSLNAKLNNFFSTISINNIFDEKYYNYAVASSSTKGAYNAYPLPGRTLMLSIGTKF